MKVLKYEILNIIRNRWILFFAILSITLSFTLIQMTGDFEKSLVTLATISVVSIPLLSILFASVSWYYSECFTELLLTQPLARESVFIARIIALLTSVTLSLPVASAIPFMLYGHFSSGLFIITGIEIFLSTVFVFIGVTLSLAIQDKIKGIGMSLVTWIYFVLIHDAIGLLLLIVFKEFPMDMPSALIGTLSPIGLARVILLVHQDSALLLGHTGALVRNFLLGIGGKIAAVAILGAWLILPLGLSYRMFTKRDY